MKEFDAVIEALLEASLLGAGEKEEIRRELQSHFYEEANDLRLQGWSDEKIKKHVLQRFGDAEQVGKQFWLLHQNKNPFLIFYSLLLTMFTWIKKHPQRALSLVLLTFTVWLNFIFFYRYSEEMELNLDRMSMPSLGVSDYYDPSDYTKLESGVFRNETQPRTPLIPEPDFDLHQDPDSYPLSNEEENSLMDQINNADLDGDGSLTIQEAHVFELLVELNNYQSDVSHSIALLTMLLKALWILVDGIALVLVLNPWLQKKRD